MNKVNNKGKSIHKSIKNRKTRRKINEQKRCFFEKISKIDKSLTRVTKIKTQLPLSVMND